MLECLLIHSCALVIVLFLIDQVMKSWPVTVELRCCYRQFRVVLFLLCAPGHVAEYIRVTMKVCSVCVSRFLCVRACMRLCLTFLLACTQICNIFLFIVTHTCHADNEPCPPCTVLTEKMCMGNHEVQPLNLHPSHYTLLSHSWGRIFPVTWLMCLVVILVGKICHVEFTSVNVSAIRVTV